jgi:hypothetical protein
MLVRSLGWYKVLPTPGQLICLSYAHRARQPGAEFQPQMFCIPESDYDWRFQSWETDSAVH